MSAQSAQSSAATEEPKQPLAVSLPETQTTTALALVTRSITDLNKIAADVVALEQKYKGVVFDVKTTAGMKAACEARLAIRKPRYTIQTMQKDAKAPLNNLKKSIDDQAEAVIARIAAVEGPIHEQIANEEQRKEDEKKAREHAERARLAALQSRVDEIRQFPLDVVGTSAEHIESIIKKVVDLVVDDTFAELKQQAEGAKATSLIRLRAAHTKVLAHEEQQRELAAERLRLVEEREFAERAQAAERARIAEAQQLAKEELERERLRQQAAADVERARIADEERVAKAARDAEAARQAAGIAAAAKANAQRMAEENAALLARQDAQLAEERRLFAERQEAERIEAERQALKEADERRLTEARQQLERDQDALRAAQEKAAAPAETPTEASLPAAPETAVEPPIAPEPEPLLASIALTELLPMQAVCTAAKQWAAFQDPDSKADQKTDRKLAARAREAVNNLLIAVEQLL
jgi:hypothetical protein